MRVTVSESNSREVHSPELASSANSRPRSRRERLVRRNFVVLALYQIVVRTGWIFKTESIIIPAVLDALGGQGWVRGCLPLFNRFGQSVPPLLWAPRVKQLSRKKRLLARTTTCMAGAFLLLALIWAIGGTTSPGWVRPVFLLVYIAFFACTGVNQLALNTLQGKLIPAAQRGRLMLFAHTIGAAAAISCAAWLLPKWLSAEGGNFASIFGFAGGCFLLAAGITTLLLERRDRHMVSRAERAPFRMAWATLRADRHLRRLAVVAVLFGTSITLFPHYQALGRGPRLNLDFTDLTWWVIVQNAGTALFSIAAGPLADRRGNRLVLRVVLLAVALAPISALTLSWIGPSASAWYASVFLLVGMTPIAMKVLHNYTLELAHRQDHPRYLSCVSLCMAAPALLSPVAGALIDLFGFDVVFLGVTGLLLAACALTWGLAEPRSWKRKLEPWSEELGFPTGSSSP